MARAPHRHRARKGGYKKRTLAKRKTPVPRRIRSTFRVVNETCKYVKLRYCDTITLDPGAGTLASHKFRVNGLYDPDYTGTGHQPMGFDQMALQFQHYAVLGSKMTAQFTASGTSTTTSQAHVGLRLDDDVDVPTVANTERELRRGKTGLLRGIWGGKGQTLTMDYNPYKFFCLKDKDLPTAHTAVVAANPAEQAYFNLWASGLDTTLNADIIYVDIAIEYYVKFFEPEEIVAS